MLSDTLLITRPDLKIFLLRFMLIIASLVGSGTLKMSMVNLLMEVFNFHQPF